MAVDFYRTAVGAQVDMMMRFNEAPEQPPPGQLPPGFEKKIMHSSFRIGVTTIMASDGCGEPAKFDGFSLSIAVATPAEADKLFAALCAGGKVVMPMGQTFWSPRFGMCSDKFGIGWMIGVHPQSK